jgi:hypothetical protein
MWKAASLRKNSVKLSVSDILLQDSYDSNIQIDSSLQELYMDLKCRKLTEKFQGRSKIS